MEDLPGSSLIEAAAIQDNLPFGRYCEQPRLTCCHLHSLKAYLEAPNAGMTPLWPFGGR